MSKVHMLRTLVKQRLNAAAEEIFGLYERTLAEYEEELCRSKEENDRQRKLLESVFKPEALKQTAAVQQTLMCKEEAFPQQQKWSTSPDQEEPEPPHIKQEQDGLSARHEDQPRQRPMEVHSTDFPVIVVHVNRENYEDKPLSSQHHQNQIDDKRWQVPLASSSYEQMKREGGEEDRGDSEPAHNLDSDRHLQADTENKVSISSKAETACSDDDWEETMDHNVCSASPKNIDIPLSDVTYNMEEKPFSCSDCGKTFDRKDSLTRHMRSHTGEKPYSCLVCGERYAQWSHLSYHIRVHTGEKPFSCSVCKKSFSSRQCLQTHMRIHMGEKPFTCSICYKTFTQKTNLTQHIRIHTGDKPFRCSFCNKSFTQKASLMKHVTLHTGEKKFRCSVCGKGFNQKSHFKNHRCVQMANTDVKPQQTR